MFSDISVRLSWGFAMMQILQYFDIYVYKLVTYNYADYLMAIA